MKRTPLKKGNKGLKRGGKLKSRHKSSEERQKNKEEGQKMIDFFNMIWSKRPHYCQVTGQFLGNEPKTYMFEHLIEKSSHPELAFEEENIILCTLEVHDRKNNGFPLPKHKEFIDKAKEKFL